MSGSDGSLLCVLHQSESDDSATEKLVMVEFRQAASPHGTYTLGVVSSPSVADGLAGEINTHVERRYDNASTTHNSHIP